MYTNYIPTSNILQPFRINNLEGQTVVEDWTRNKKLTLASIEFASEQVGDRIEVHVYPRHLIQEIWSFFMQGQDFTLPPYSFRAFARGNLIVLFDDETETADSLLWLLLHEVAHIWLTRTPKLRAQFRSQSLPSGYLTSDSAHESSPEEQFANMMADRWFKQFSNRSGSFHRIWWRKRVLEHS